MKQVMMKFNPFTVIIGRKPYRNISPSSVKRLDETLVNLCESNKMEMDVYTDFAGINVLSFKPIKSTNQEGEE